MERYLQRWERAADIAHIVAAALSAVGLALLLGKDARRWRTGKLTEVAPDASR